MSRAVNINASRAHVEKTCAKLNAATTVIEDLDSGGTRVVFKNAEDADAVAKAYENKVLLGAVTRTPIRQRRGASG